MPAAIELYRSVDLLVRARIGFDSPHCVVTFDSYTDNRSLARDGFGEAFLASRSVNAIHILSRDNDWYLLPDIERALEAASSVAKPFDRVTTYGSSMGAYAAIRLGRLAGATAAIALSPQFSLDPRVVPFEDRWPLEARRLDYEIERRLARTGFVPSAYVFYDPSDPDARHADLFRPWLDVRDVRLPDCGHPVTGFLAEVGLLDRAALEPARGVFDREVFQRDALAKRECAPQHYLTLASRPIAAVKKLELVRRAYELFSSDVGYMARYGEALWMAGRHDDAVAMFDQAMRAKPDHDFVLRYVCAFLEASGRRGAARAVADWLTRLQPGAAPVESLAARLNRPGLADAPERLRRLARLPLLRGSRTAAPRQALSPPLARLNVASGAPSPRLPASPASIRSWVRHASTIGAVWNASVDVVLIGDSLAEQWPAGLWAGQRILNLGSSGDRIEHLLWRLACLEDGAIDAKAAIVIIGMNNLLAGDEIHAVIGAVEDVVREIRRTAPAAQIVAVALPPFGPDFQFRDGDRKAFNAALGALSDAAVVDEPAHWAPHGAEASCYQPDCLHFSRTGYQRLTKAAAQALGFRQ
jgi:lysophospholipase L1-like esterase